MFHNVKVDIIYYKTNTDFEMEFNLCGCCRMRLLTSKSPDQKTMVNSLARAVSRSRIIIVVGNLFGEDGVISTVSKAIKTELQTVKTDTGGISYGEDIKIIKNSTPLATTEGFFGGCIIEHGKQTMILVSDSKNIRKNIMENLIHPYIEELCAEDLKNKAALETPEVSEEDIEMSENMPSEDIEVQESEPAAEQDSLDDLPKEPQITAEEIPNIVIPPIQTPSEESGKTAVNSSSIFADIKTEMSADSAPNSVFEPPIFILDTDDNETAATPEIPEIKEDEIFISRGMTFETDEKDLKTVAETEPETETKPEPETKTEDFFDINSFNSRSQTLSDTEPQKAEEAEKPERKPHSALNFSILAIAVLLLVFFALLVFFIFYIPQKSGIAPYDFVKHTFSELFS